METSNQSHDAHAMRGPHFNRGLTAEQRDAVQRWLEETETDAELGIRELAEFISGFKPLEDAIFRKVSSARFGGFQVSSLIHAVALLGIRRTRMLLKTYDNASMVG